MDRIASFANLRPLVARIRAVGRTGLFTDVDGTLSPIVAVPQAAKVEPACRCALARLCERFDLVAAVSGRIAEDAERMVGLPGLLYVGNHGLEVRRNGQTVVASAVRAYVPAIAGAVAALRNAGLGEGIFVEDKTYTATVHYRGSPNPQSARAGILAAIASLPALGLKVTEERMAVSVHPPIEADKGTAVLDLVQRFGLRGAFFLGDDRTDVDALLALHRWRESGHGQALLIAVANDEAPEAARLADVVLSGVEEVCRFLGWLVEIQGGL